MAATHHQVLIVGGGTAGITLAASLRKRGPRKLDIAIVEPADLHYYQPAFTLVGAGLYDLEKTRRPVAELVPPRVSLIRAAVAEFKPEQNAVKLSTGDFVNYDWLIVCTGLSLDWDKVAGLSATLGRNGVCSNYSPDSVRYTAELIRGLKAGAKAVFTQAPLPFKCPGAPQKIAYLTADHLRRKRLLKNCDLGYYVHAPVIFGVPFFAKQLVKVAERYGIKVNYQHNLVAVDGAAKTAAAVRKQSPVVVRNLLSAMKGKETAAAYDGYASCPLTTARGKAIVAEFIYGGKVTPTWPMNPSRETRLGWWIKATALPIFYWTYMLKGRERFFKHDTTFQGDAVN